MRFANGVLLWAALGWSVSQGAVAFEPNRGQVPKRVQFIARTERGTVALQADRLGSGQYSIGFGSARRNARGEGYDPLPGVRHYAWADAWGVPQFGGVRYRGVYPGVDLAYHDTGGNLEFDFEVASGVRVDAIQLTLAQDAEVEGDGSLRSGAILLRRPQAWQHVDGQRVSVPAAFRLHGTRRVGFKLGAYRQDLPLVIDPILEFATYWGGSKEETDVRLLASPSGDEAIFLAGNTTSEDFQAALPEELGLNAPVLLPSTTAFVTRFTGGASTVDWSLFLGFGQRLLDFKQDSLGNLYVLGSTTSANISGSQSGFIKKLNRYGADWFVMKLDAKTGRVKASTYLGVDEDQSGFRFARLAVDPSGGAFIVGGGSLRNGTTPGALRSSPTMAFAIRLNAALSGLIYATYLEGYDFRNLPVADVDGQGSLWIGSLWSEGTTFPSVNPIPGISQLPSNQRQGYVMKLNPQGTARLFASYVHAGPNGSSTISDLRIAPNGSVYVTGLASGNLFPVTNPLSAPASANPPQEFGSYPFIMKLAPEGTQIQSATHFRSLQAPHVTWILFRPNGLPCYSGFNDSFSFDQTAGGLGTDGSRFGIEVTLSCADDLERELSIKTRIPVIGNSIAPVAQSNSRVLFAGSTTFLPVPENKTEGRVQPKAAGGTDNYLVRVSLDNPVPKIEQVVPASVLLNGTTTAVGVSINGTGFAAAMDMRLNGTPVKGTFDSEQAVTLNPVDPASLRLGANTVTASLPAPGGGSSSGTILGINGSPTSATITPTFIAVGSADTKVVIRATNLTASSVLGWDGQVRSATYVADSTRGGHFELVLSSAELAQVKTIELTVTNVAPGGGTSPVALFRVVPQSTTALPSITTSSLVYSPEVPLPATFGLSALNVSAGARVTWDGQEVPTTVVSAARVDVTVPAQLKAFGVHRVFVTSGGMQSNTVSLAIGLSTAVQGVTAAASAEDNRIYFMTYGTSQPTDPAVLWVIDSGNGTVLERRSTNIKPPFGFGRLVVTNDGKFVYVYAMSGTTIQRYSVEGKAFDLEWQVPEGLSWLGTIANRPGAVVVSFIAQPGNRVVVYENGRKLPAELTGLERDGQWFAEGETVLGYTGVCWYTLRMNSEGIPQQTPRCMVEPEGTISDGALRYVLVGGRAVLVSSPFRGGASDTAALVDLERRRLIQIPANSGTPIEYNMDTGEQRLRPTPSSLIALLPRSQGGIVAMTAPFTISFYPVP